MDESAQFGADFGHMSQCLRELCELRELRKAGVNSVEQFRVKEDSCGLLADKTNIRQRC